MNKKFVLVVIFVAISISLLSACSFSDSKEDVYQELIPVRIAITKQPLSSLAIIAQEKGFFEKNGLDVDLQMYATGIESKNAVFYGDADIGETVDFVLASLALGDVNFKIITSVFDGQINYAVVKDDTDIYGTSDIAGKKIGIKKDSSAEYYTGRLLTFEGMSMDDIEIVDVHPPLAAEYLENGSIDVAVLWHPHDLNLGKYYEGKVRTWPIHENQNLYWFAFSTNHFVDKNPEIMTRYIHSLVLAEEYIKDYESESKKILANILEVDQEFLTSTWGESNFRVSLDQAILPMFEDQMRWKIETNGTDKTEVANMLTKIHIDTLELLYPNKVTII